MTSEEMTIAQLVDWANSELGLSGDKDEAAEARPVTRRTIYYYINQGLLPPPEGAGSSSFYGERHRLVLKLIKLNQEAHVPLQKIRYRLHALEMASDAEVRAEITRLEALREAARQRGFSSDVAVLRNSELDGSTEAQNFWARSSLPEDTASLRLPFPEEEAGSKGAPRQTIWQKIVLAPGVELSYQLTNNARRQQILEDFIHQALRRLSKLRAEAEDEG